MSNPTTLAEFNQVQKRRTELYQWLEENESTFDQKVRSQKGIWIKVLMDVKPTTTAAGAMHATAYYLVRIIDAERKADQAYSAIIGKRTIQTTWHLVAEMPWPYKLLRTEERFIKLSCVSEKPFKQEEVDRWVHGIAALATDSTAAGAAGTLTGSASPAAAAPEPKTVPHQLPSPLGAQFRSIYEVPPVQYVTWSEVISGDLCPISSGDNVQLEASYQQGENKVLVNCEHPEPGGAHQRLADFVQGKITARDEPYRPGSTSQVQLCRVDMRPPEPLTSKDVDVILRTCAHVDARVAEMMEYEHVRGYRISLSDIDVRPIMFALHQLIQGFKHPRCRDRYGYLAGTDDICMTLLPKQKVPRYYANNTENQSTFQRKMLSLAGLRNLVLFGAEIFTELRETHFSGDIKRYPNSRPSDRPTGPNKMIHYTGNLVDLDYVVMRCNDPQTLAALNAARVKQGMPRFTSFEDLAKSDYVRDIALSQARQLIADFSTRFSLSDRDRIERCIHMDSSTTVQRTGNHQHRGVCPVWHYENHGVSTIHVNVPNMDDVYGALLKSPFHLAKALALVFRKHEIGSPGFVAAMDELYDQAVVDSCFNAKWKAIEEFVSKMEQTGSIRFVLDRIQQRHQEAFTNVMMNDDADRAGEAALMKRIVAEERLEGYDEAIGKRRPLTSDDVDCWIASTA